MGGRKHIRRSRETLPEPSRNGPLQVLVVGGAQAVDQAQELLDALGPTQRTLRLVGVACIEEVPVSLRSSWPKDVPVFDDYETIIRENAPDVVIFASEDRTVFKRLISILPDHTRVLDPFALWGFQTLKHVRGQLGNTEHRVRNLELIKDVLTSGSNVSIMVVDEDFKVLDIGHTLLQRTNMSRSGCLGRACHWVLHRRLEPCIECGGDCPALDVIRTDRSSHRVRVEPREGGGQRYFTVSTYPLGEDQRGKKCVLMVWKDVTQGLAPLLDRQAETMKADFSRMVHQDKMAALGKLAAAAVHEINNPLQGILTFSKLMRASLEGAPPRAATLAQFCSYLDLMSSEAARCGQILRSLLSFARMDTLEKKAFDLNPVLDQVILLVGNRMELQGVKFHRVVPSPFGMYGDRNQIKQVLLNLILNAIEAMPDGGSVSVSAEVSLVNNSSRVYVSDTGPGIPQSIRGNIFEPFVTTKDGRKGVGLGLSVAHGIIAQHGGSIEIQSQENRGATFVVNLPLNSTVAESDVC